MTTKIMDRPEIWQIPVELPQSPLKNLNSYVIRTPEKNLIIDTGFNRAECREALWAGIRELGLDMGKTDVFITHGHTDHMGLVEDFVERGCTVYLNQLEYDYFCNVLKGDARRKMDDLYRREGFPEEEIARQKEGNQNRRYVPRGLFPITAVGDGERIMLGDTEGIFLHTPGHSPGHMMLYLPESQVLFSGDHVLFDISPNIGVWMGTDDALGDYLESLKKTRALAVKVTLPAHRGTFKKNLYERIDELLAHHEQRLLEIQRAIAACPGASAYYIAAHITWSGRGLAWNAFPTHQKWFAMGETLAHLYYLVRAGRVSQQEGEHGIAYYNTEGFQEKVL